MIVIQKKRLLRSIKIQPLITGKMEKFEGFEGLEIATGSSYYYSHSPLCLFKLKYDFKPIFIKNHACTINPEFCFN